MSTPGFKNRAALNSNIAHQLIHVVGFDVQTLNRIKSNSYMVNQLNQFARQGGRFATKKQGADYLNNVISISPSYARYSVLAHELGHALGRDQATNKTFTNAKAYALARGIGEAEAIYNEYQTIQQEIAQNGLANVRKNYSHYSAMTEGQDHNKNRLNLYQQLNTVYAKSSKTAIYDFLSKQNMYGMSPSTAQNGISLTYYEHDIKWFLSNPTKSRFVQDYYQAFGKGKPYTAQAAAALVAGPDAINFIKQMADFDLLGDGGNNTIKAAGAKNRFSLLHPNSKYALTLNDAAYLYGDAGNDVLQGGSFNDKLLGGSGNDSLYGNAGNDTLAGNDGADWLDGGAGFDTYVADVMDTISDSDGKGEVLYGSNQIKLTGGQLSAWHMDAPYRSDDGRISYYWNQKAKTLRILSSSDPKAAKGLQINNFKNGDLGINLGAVIIDIWPPSSTAAAPAATTAGHNPLTAAGAAATVHNLIQAMAAMGADGSAAAFSNNDSYSTNLPTLAPSAL